NPGEGSRAGPAGRRARAVTTTLHDRLRRLRRGSEGADGTEAAVPGGGGQLERLERALVGATGGGLSLKERLQRLADVAARGPGPAAFLVGLGFVAGDRFRVRQYFMRAYPEEPALLRGLAEDLRRFSRIVTFNGRAFDVPLLESRYRLSRERFPLECAVHLDLLHPARRLWKLRLESCRLQSLA